MYFMYLLYIRRIGPVTGIVPTTRRRLRPRDILSMWVHGNGPGFVSSPQREEVAFSLPACAMKNVSVCSWTNTSCFTIFIYKWRMCAFVCRCCFPRPYLKYAQVSDGCSLSCLKVVYFHRYEPGGLKSNWVFIKQRLKNEDGWNADTRVYDAWYSSSIFKNLVQFWSKSFYACLNSFLFEKSKVPLFLLLLLVVKDDFSPRRHSRNFVLF